MKNLQRDLLDKNYNEIREQLLVQHDDLGLVLKCHLIAENYLNKYLIEAKGLQNIHKAKMTCGQKIKLLDETDGVVFDNKGALVQLNRIRNDFAHNFQTPLEVKEGSCIAQYTKRFLNGVNKRYAAVNEELGNPENNEVLKTLVQKHVIEKMKATPAEKGKFLGDNYGLLTRGDPREIVAHFVASFCKITVSAILSQDKCKSL